MCHGTPGIPGDNTWHSNNERTKRLLDQVAQTNPFGKNMYHVGANKSAPQYSKYVVPHIVTSKIPKSLNFESGFEFELQCKHVGEVKKLSFHSNLT